MALRSKRAFDLVVLPGGEPGATSLAGDPTLAALLRRRATAAQPIGAICAAPKVLAAAGLLRDRDATSHPSVEAQLRQAGARYSTARVVRDGAIVTSRGPGTALEFALALLELLGLTDRAAEMRAAMLVP
jgi:4-methyl-5(b-hydroxyethyl)-thiazole monophosphate biosynthesis